MTEASLTRGRRQQAVRPNLIKWLAVFCVMDCVGATTLPSSPPPKFADAVSNPSYNTVCSPRYRHPRP
eukprot:scaffold126255_cov21-Phaeocystis_antarctica.AAC.1